MLCLIKSLFPFLPFPLCFSFPFLLFPFPFYVVVSFSFPFSFFPLFLPSTPPILSRVSQDYFPLSLSSSLFTFLFLIFPSSPPILSIRHIPTSYVRLIFFFYTVPHLFWGVILQKPFIIFAGFISLILTPFFCHSIIFFIVTSHHL